jgi:hypothetical protein
MTTPNPQQPPQAQGPKLEMAEGLKPQYTNLARISHSPADIVIDFAQMLPGEGKAVVEARILMSPLSAKLLLRALQDNLARYETTFGEIKIPISNTLADNLFKGLHPPEPPKE